MDTTEQLREVCGYIYRLSHFALCQRISSTHTHTHTHTYTHTSEPLQLSIIRIQINSSSFAHAIDTDDAATPPTAVSDCLGATAAKNRQQLKLGKGALLWRRRRRRRRRRKVYSELTQ